jgi:hypothetical protein
MQYFKYCDILANFIFIYIIYIFFYQNTCTPYIQIFHFEERVFDM